MMKILGLASLLVGATASALFAQAPQAQNSFSQTNLVANSEKYHPQIIDPTMIDAWGIALRPPGAGGHIWVNNGFHGNSVEYIGDVNGMPLHQDGLTSITLDTPQFTDHGYAMATGISYNSASDITGQPVEFPVEGPADNRSTKPATPIPGGAKGAAKFVFCTEDGCINAWRANTKESMGSAPVIVDYSKTAKSFPYHVNCVFSGCTLTNNAVVSPAFAAQHGNHLFATDFRMNKIVVFDNQWKNVTKAYHFETPDSVRDLHVFNILDLDGHLFVTYADFDPTGDEGMEENDGDGLGHIVEYDEKGHLVRDYRDKGKLNAPWGVIIAPPGFGRFGGDVLVSNFGDGTIAAFDRKSGKFVDNLRDAKGAPIVINKVWGMVFGNGVSLGDAHSLYFTAGPHNEFDGLFGKLTFDQPAASKPVPASTAKL